MKMKIYILKFEDGSYFREYPTQTCIKKEDAKRLTWEEAENLRNQYIREQRIHPMIESGS